MQKKTGSFKEDFSRNAYYRFLRNAHANWLRFTTLLSEKIINGHLCDLTSEDRVDCFVVDDSLFKLAVSDVIPQDSRRIKIPQEVPKHGISAVNFTFFLCTVALQTPSLEFCAFARERRRALRAVAHKDSYPPPGR